MKLYGGWEVNLHFTGELFDGTLHATSEGPVRILLPPRFATAFEASVSAEAEFVCRADIGAQLMRREEGGRVIYSFGEGEPAIRCVSVKGPVVIDNAAGPWEEAVENAMMVPRRPMVYSQASADSRFLL